MPGSAAASKGSKRRRSARLASSDSVHAVLPPVPEHAALDVPAAFTTGGGRAVAAPSPEALLAALSLFEDGGNCSGSSSSSGSATAASTDPANLPVGASWPLLRVLTPAGLSPAFVQPDVVGRCEGEEGRARSPGRAPRPPLPGRVPPPPPPYASHDAHSLLQRTAPRPTGSLHAQTWVQHGGVRVKHARRRWAHTAGRLETRQGLK